MKPGNWARLSLVSTLLMAGCSGFWDLPSSITPTTDSSGVFYVLNQTTRQLAGYSISSGTLTSVSSNSPYSLASAPYSIAIAPSGNFLFVGTLSGVYLYTIGSGGALTIGNSGDPISTDIASALQVSGSWLIVANSVTTGEVELNAYSISSSTGAYTGTAENQTFSISNASVQQMVLSPKKDYLFVALGTGGTLAVPFSTSSSNPLGSTAHTISVANSGGSALSVAVDPSERIFYVGETLGNSAGTSGGLRVFNYSSLSGTLSPSHRIAHRQRRLAPHAILPRWPPAVMFTLPTGKAILQRATLPGSRFRPRELRTPSLREAASRPASSRWGWPRIATAILCWPSPPADRPQQATPTSEPTPSVRER